MHLIDTRTRRLVAMPSPPDRYAILSHTWDNEEITFQDITSSQSLKTRPGYAKFNGAIKLAIDEGYELLWIDNCCIDKSSSAELSEAINSMFEWYRQASVCYVYLSDILVESSHLQRARNGIDGEVMPALTWPELLRKQLSQCRWLRRCWTLQELIAPSRVVFYSREWWHLGDKRTPEWRAFLVEETRISDAALTSTDGYKLASVAQKMSWAADRNATRAEDVAYSLFGLFGVNMAPLYGEGGQSAFRRLQEEIIRRGVDDSILAWDPTAPSSTTANGSQSALASSPRCFRNKGDIVYRLSDTVVHLDPLTVTQWGLSIRVPIKATGTDNVIAILSSRSERDMGGVLGIKLVPTMYTAHSTAKTNLPHRGDFFKRDYSTDVLLLKNYEMDEDPRHRITIIPDDGILARMENSLQRPPFMRRTRLAELPYGFTVTAVEPKGLWDPELRQIDGLMNTVLAVSDKPYQFLPRQQLFLISDLRRVENGHHVSYFIQLDARCDDHEDTLNIEIIKPGFSRAQTRLYLYHSKWPSGPRPYDPADQSACRFSNFPDSTWKSQSASSSVQTNASTGSRLRVVVRPESSFGQLGLLLSIDEYVEVDGSPGKLIGDESPISFVTAGEDSDIENDPTRLSLQEDARESCVPGIQASGMPPTSRIVNR